MRLLKPGGRALIYVWAFEQEYNKQRSKYLKDQNKEYQGIQEPHEKFSRPLEDNHRTVGNIQDVSKVPDIKLSVHTNRTAFNTQDLLVPWHLKEGNICRNEDSAWGNKNEKRKEKASETSLSVCSSVNGSNCNSDPTPGSDSTMSSGSSQVISDIVDNSDSKSRTSGDSAHTSPSERKSLPIFHRYYHVFQQGELEQLCDQLTGVKVQSSYYDQGNWCVILEKD